MPERVQAELVQPPFHEWTLPGGDLWAEFHRLKGGFLLRFPQFADFEISEDGSWNACYPCRTLTEATREHLYLNQVLPLVQSLQGKLVFHAAAVEMKAGAIAFLAPSGRGKSTLAAAFAAHGNRFLTDDSLVLETAESGFRALPSAPTIRLWEDSQAALLPAGAAMAPPVFYSPKGKFLASNHLPHCQKSRPLKAAYFLGDGSADEIDIRPLRGSETVAKWVSHSFLLNVDDSAALEVHFEGVTALARVVPSFDLDYPRRYQNIDQLRQTLSDHAEQLDCAL